MRPEDRRQQILRCALAEAARLGLERARPSDVARAAGVAVSTVFHYFPTREELALGIVEEVDRFLLEDLLAATEDPTRPAPQVIEAILMVFRDAIDTHEDYVRVWLEWSVSVRGGLWRRYLVFYRAALDGIGAILARGVTQGAIRPGTDLKVAARVVVSLAHMVAQMSFSGATADDVAATVHSLMKAYLEHAPPGVTSPE